MQLIKKKNIEKDSTISLYQLCWEFLKIGTIGFGGGWVIIALIQDKFVRQKQLLSDEEFTTGISLSQFLGAFAVNTASFVGRKLKGIQGSLLATFCFLLPSFIIVCILSGLYFKFNKVFSFENILRGISPVVIAIMLSTAFDLSNKIKKDVSFLVILFFVIIGGFLNINYVALLIVSGLLQILFFQMKNKKNSQSHLFSFSFLQFHETLPGVSIFSFTSGIPSLLSVGLSFLGIGFIFFGGGYALLPLLKNIFVDKLHWISNHDFLVGIAISQTTPGPFAIIATFLGYYLKGVVGAFVATVAIFLPAFILMQILIYIQSNLKDNLYIQAFLKGINIAIVGQLLLLSYLFFIETLLPLSSISILLLIISWISFSIYKVPPLLLILIGIVYGLCLLN